MGLNIFNARLSEISNKDYLFLHYDYFRLKKLIDKDIHNLPRKVNEYFEVISGYAFSSKDYTDVGVKLIRISNISKYGELLYTEMSKLPIEYQDKYSKYLLKNNDIIIGMTGDGKNFKTGIVLNSTNNVLLNQRVGILRLKENIKYNEKFFYYMTKLDFFQNQIKIVAMGKTQKNVSPFDLLKIQIPNTNLKIQNKAIEKIKPIEKEIQTLKAEKKDDLEIINNVFSKEFNIDLTEVKRLDSTKQFNLKLQNTILKNDLIRTSFKWHKLKIIQSYMYKDIKCIEKLSNFIISTKNGWSPQSSEVEKGTPILGQEHILKNGKISLLASKYTVLTRNNIEDFYIKKNDFFVSRGNTVELVALAGIVTDDIEDNILYPDLYIKIEFNEEYINKQYMAYLFNSFFGRIYFKHVAKGKNQTMVKVSSKELHDFYVPLPDKTMQQEIVDKIQTQIDSQKDVDKQIEDKQGEISKIIEDCIQKNG